MAAKKRRKKGPGGGGAARPAQGATAPSTGSMVVVGVGALLAAWLGFGWFAVPLLTVPLIVGAAVALCLGTRAESAAIAGTSGSLAGLAAAVAYRAEVFATLYDTTPQWMNYDVLRGMYQAVYVYLSTHPASSSSGAVVLPLSGLFAGAVAFGVAWLLDRYRAKGFGIRGVVTWSTVALLCVVHVASVLVIAGTPQDPGTGQPSFLTWAGREPADASYGYDSIIYMRAYYEMLKGRSYYDGLVAAAAGDIRLRDDPAKNQKSAVRNGKFVGWADDPAFIREPLAFLMWKALSPGGGTGVVYLGALLGSIVLAALFWGLQPHLGERSLLAVAALSPYLLFMSIWANIFFPDYWAALAVMVSLAMLMRGQWVAGAGFAFLAAAFREVLIPWLLIVAALAFFWWLRGGRSREWTVRWIAAASLGALWFLLYWLHLRTGAGYIAESTRTAAGYALGRSGSGFQWKVLQPTYYLMWPYGFLRFPGTVLWALAPAGVFFALSGTRKRRSAVIAFPLFWIAWYLTMGASSSYWGQGSMPMAIVGSVALLLSADRIGAVVRETRERWSEARGSKAKSG